MSDKIFTIESADGSCIAVGYDSMRDARDDAQKIDGARARQFENVWELRQFYTNDDWLERYTDDELRYGDDELEEMEDR